MVLGYFIDEAGTSALLLASICVLPRQYGKDIIVLSFLKGCLAMGLAFVFGTKSGGHGNPAVTLCAGFLRKISIWKTITMLIAQFAGGYAGYILACMYLGVKSNSDEFVVGLNTQYVNNKEAYCLFECVTMLLLLLVRCSGWKNIGSASSSTLFIGLTTFVCSLFATPLTGASMNPLFSIIPAYLANNTKLATWQLMGQGMAISSVLVLSPFLKSTTGVNDMKRRVVFAPSITR